MFVREFKAENKNTDVFPSVNFVLGAAQLEHPPELQHDGQPAEFRELAEFEFTDVIGNRAVEGNSNLQRA